MIIDDKNRAVGYARVSSKDQEDTGYSLPAQEKLLNEYAGRCGLSLVKVFAIQESASGRVQRKIFHEMLDYIRKQKIRTAIVETTDRLTRNFTEAIEIDKWIVEDCTRQIHLVKENCVLQKDSRSHEWFMWRVKVATAEYYIRLLSENVKKGQKEKLAQGWLPAKPPIGYKTVGEKGRKIHVPDESMAPLVTQLYDLYARGGYSVKTVNQKMYELGLRNRSGNKICDSHCHRLLTDPFYYGMNQWKGQVTKGEHQPIISAETFHKVQELLRGSYAPRISVHHPLFQGVFRCHECNCQITWEKHKGRYYGHCNHYKNCSQRGCMREDRLDMEVADAIFGITLMDSDPRIHRMLEWVQQALKESHEDEMAFRDTATGELNKKLEQITRRLDNLYDDKLDGKINGEFYQKKFEQYKADQEDVMRNLESHTNANLKYYEMGITVLELVKTARDIYLSPARTLEEKRVLMSFIFDDLRIKDGKFVANYKEPYGNLMKKVLEYHNDNDPFFQTIEPENEPDNKRKNRALDPVHPTWLPG